MSNACSLFVHSSPVLFICFAFVYGAGFLAGQRWMFNRAQDASVQFGIEALTKETVKVTAYFTCIEECALHYALWNGWKRLCGLFRGRGEGKTGV